ncbi:MAG TPA: hypothetical protein VGS06_23310, partial [Streptosporangiaceae bacterium]|nr:hypothetical protein [Streptosporangiaceae bacterium]
MPWTTGGGDEAGAEEEDDDEDDDDAGAEEEDPDDDEPDAEVAEPDDPGAVCEPEPVASTPGAIEAPGLADGASPLPLPPGELPGPREGAPRELPTTPAPALPRAPAPGAWDCGAPPPRTSTALTPAAAAAVAALAARAWECRRTRRQPDTPGGRLGLG